jgi:hypothetical protein
MREFSKITPAMWRDKRFRSLPSSDAKLVSLYLLASEHQNSAGAYRLPTLYACSDLGWDEERFAAARAEVLKADLFAFDPETEEFYCRGWFKTNPAMNPKHAQSIIRRISELESDEIRERAEAEFAQSQEQKARAKAEISGSVHSLDDYSGGRLTRTRYMQGRA